MSTLYDRVSWSSHYTFDDHLKSQRSPYVKFHIIEGHHLRDVFDSDAISPYICIYQGEKVFTTQTAREESSHSHYWDETGEIEVSALSPVFLILFDYDEYSNDQCIAAYELDSHLYEQ